MAQGIIRAGAWVQSVAARRMNDSLWFFVECMIRRLYVYLIHWSSVALS
jgi:hypothetical protein